MKKILSLFLALTLTLGMIPSRAVVPYGAIEGVVASVVASAGYKWVFSDDTTANQVAGHLQALWTEYRLTDPDNIKALDGYRDDVFVSDTGNFVVDFFLTTTINNFLTWLHAKYNLAPGQTTPIVQPGIYLDGLEVSTYDGALPSDGKLVASQFANRVPIFSGNTSYSFDGFVLHWREGSDFELFYGGVSRLYVGTSSMREGGLLRVSNGKVYIWYHRTLGYDEVHPVPLTNYRPLDFTTSGGVSITTPAAGTANPAADISDGQSLVVSPGVELPQIITGEAVGQATLEGLAEGTANPSATIASDASLPVALPELGDYDLSALGSALTDVFPFCIPWDFVEVVSALNATPQPPYFSVDLFDWLRDRRPDLGNTDFTLDFGQPQYAIIGTVSRWATTIGFCLALLFATKRLIWTTGG